MAPDFPDVRWEVHVTRAADVDGIAMGGGKLLIGERFIEDYRLTDGELAMVVAHEVAHVLGNHVGETYSEAYSVAYRMLPKQPFRSLDAVRGTLETDYRIRSGLGMLARMQELEADALGYVLAVRAGYRGTELLGFFAKIAAADDERPRASFGADTHPGGATRLLHARAVKLLVEAGLL